MVSDGLNDNRRVKNAQKVRKRIVITWEGKPAYVDRAAIDTPESVWSWFRKGAAILDGIRL
jgi:hypothetical protein